MSTPSLLNIPYLYKAGTLYSQIPESGAGDFTVSRTTTVANRSTRINKDGLIELVNDNVPRLDYPLGGAVNGCPALLVEPSAQNLLLQSETWNVSPWTATSGSQGATISGNVTTSPDGTTNADKLIEAAVTGSHFCLQSFTLTSGTTYTTSFFAKASERTLGRLRMLGSSAYWDIDFDLTLGTATGGTNPFIQNYGNGWYRIGGTFTANQPSNNFILSLRDASGNTSYTGNGTNGFFVYGAQLEVGSVATSYIPTTTAAVTRSAEIITDTTAGDLIGQGEGTIYTEVDVRNFVNFSRVVALSNGTGSNAIGLQLFLNGAVKSLRVGLSFLGSGQVDIIAAMPNAVNKIAVGYKQNDFVVYLNGSPVGTNTNCNVPAMNRVDLGNINGVNIIADRIRAVELYPNRLTNAQLATLTAP